MNIVRSLSGQLETSGPTSADPEPSRSKPKKFKNKTPLFADTPKAFIRKLINANNFISIVSCGMVTMVKKRVVKEGEAGTPPPLTRSMHYLLSFLRSKARGEYVYRVDIKQADLARELNISRQALNIKLKEKVSVVYRSESKGGGALTIGDLLKDVL